MSTSTKAVTTGEGSHIDIDSFLRGHIIGNIIYMQWEDLGNS